MKVNDINSNKLESRKFYSEEELVELFGIGGSKPAPVKQSDAFKVLQNIEARKSGTHPVKFSDGYTVDIDPIIAKKVNAWVAKRDKKDQAGAEGLVRSWEGFQKIAKVLGIQDKLPVPRTVEDTNEELNAILSLAGVSTMTPVQAIVAESKEEVTEMNKYGISAVHKGGKFYAFRHGKMVGGPFDTMQELQDFQLKSIENESYDMTPGGQVEYEFTKADFLANEDENMHTENAMELVVKFGTEEEIKRMEMIMTAHNTRGHIEPAEQEERDSYIRKYYPMLEDVNETELDITTGKPVPKTVMGVNVRSKEDKIKDKKDQIALAKRNAPKSGLTQKDVPQLEKELAKMQEVASPEEQEKPSSVAMDTLRLIVTNKQNMPVKFADGQMKVDLYTASAITQVYDKVNDANKQKMLNMLGTKEGMVKLTNLVFGMLNKQESISEGLEQDLVDMYKGDGEAGLADYVINHLGMTEKRFEKEFEKAGNAMKFIKNYVKKTNFPQAKINAESLEISEDAYNRIEAFRDSRLQELSSTEADEVKGILEAFEADEVKVILDKHDVKSIDDIELGSEVYEELFAYYMDSGEMPYGVMKARDGMPDEWIADRLDDLGLLEQNIESNNVFNNLQSVKRASEACGAEHSPKKKKTEGYAVLPPMPEKYVARDGLEGPIMTRSGKVVYYDNVEGKYYDPDTDMYLTYDEWKAFDPELPIKQEDEVMEKMTVTMADMKANTKAYQNLLQGDDKYVADKELMKHILANGGREKLAASCNYESAEIERLKHLSGL